MEVPVTEAIHGRGRKRKREPEKWKANRAKIERYSSQSLPGKITCNHNSKSFGCKNLRVKDQLDFHRAFYATPIKKNQDALILKCCSVNKTNRKRPTKNYVMRNFFANGILPNEKRGGVHKYKKYSTQRQAVYSFIKSLKCVGAHYCRGTTTQRKYLPSELNIKKLYKMFIEKNPNSPVKQSYFRAIFNEDFNLGFGSPRTDKNLVLPKVPDQSCYYSRQYNFTIVQGGSKDPLNKNTTFSYVWTEDEYAKGANQIASAVYDRLNKSDLTNITHLRLVADGCAGQNKNLVMVSMCSRWILQHPHIKKIELVFPITGHSFMPADRVFGNIEKRIRKLEVITQPSDYTDIISECATVTKLDEIDFLDWKTSIQNIVKTPAQLHFKISQCKRIIIRRTKKQGDVMIRGELFYNSDTGAPRTFCRKGKKAELIQPSTISKGIDVKPLKLRDVRNLLLKHYGENWKELPYLEYYKNVLFNIDEEEIQLLEENGENETNDIEEETCERVEDVTLRI
ncbi:unnamed protein product [Spodoptera littoralis]|uniref:DUF7869 domain-containing protein n=1 Tax=Spodoptera littoralis TaxID=7109 RepID=A0A9P0IAA8_SPOLI|nr:unnamed protein product [Spodoptera littoralis]CAH1643163.1 unnamed protein product [Spodoptera littoralis]